MSALSEMHKCLERFKSGDMAAADEFDRLLDAAAEENERMKRTVESMDGYLASAERFRQGLLASDVEFTPIEDDGIPQDTSLPDDVVERVSLVAVADLISESAGDYINPENLSCVTYDGAFDMLRLVRVISAALKEASHG